MGRASAAVALASQTSFAVVAGRVAAESLSCSGHRKIIDVILSGTGVGIGTCPERTEVLENSRSSSGCAGKIGRGAGKVRIGAGAGTRIGID